MLLSGRDGGRLLGWGLNLLGFRRFGHAVRQGGMCLFVYVRSDSLYQ